MNFLNCVKKMETYAQTNRSPPGVTHHQLAVQTVQSKITLIDNNVIFYFILFKWSDIQTVSHIYIYIIPPSILLSNTHTVQCSTVCIQYIQTHYLHTVWENVFVSRSSSNLRHHLTPSMCLWRQGIYSRGSTS